MDGKDYIKNSVGIIKDLLYSDGKYLKTGKITERPVAKNYRPELVDTTLELGTAMASRYQQMIGILTWAVELGRVEDILLEVALLSSYLAIPQEGHLEAAYNIFAYLDKHPNAPMAFDGRVPRITLVCSQGPIGLNRFTKELRRSYPPECPSHWAPQ